MKPVVLRNETTAFLSPQHFRRWGDLCARIRKKNKKNTAFSLLGDLCAHTIKKTNTNGMFAAGGALVLTQEKKPILDAEVYK